MEITAPLLSNAQLHSTIKGMGSLATNLAVYVKIFFFSYKPNHGSYRLVNKD